MSGPPVPTELSMKRRLAVVREADLDGASRPMHDVMFRHLEAIEEAGCGDDHATHDCGSA